jgi:hypothetical protein
LLDDQTNRVQHRSVAAGGLTRRHVFFRFSTRQCMVLIITLSVCFAVNRKNYIDDFIYVMSIFIKAILPVWTPPILYLVFQKASRPGRNAFRPGRSMEDGHDPRFCSGSRADAMVGRLRSIARLVSEQRRGRGKLVDRDSATPESPGALHARNAHCGTSHPLFAPSAKGDKDAGLRPDVPPYEVGIQGG